MDTLSKLRCVYARLTAEERNIIELASDTVAAFDAGQYDQELLQMDQENLAATLHSYIRVREEATEALRKIRRAVVAAQGRSNHECP